MGLKPENFYYRCYMQNVVSVSCLPSVLGIAGRVCCGVQVLIARVKV